jgi:hypothetical protein
VNNKTVVQEWVHLPDKVCKVVIRVAEAALVQVTQGVAEAKAVTRVLPAVAREVCNPLI